MADRIIFPKEFAPTRPHILDENQTLEGKNEWVRKTELAMTHLFTNGGDYDRKYGAEIILHNLYMALQALPNDPNLGRMIAFINNIDSVVLGGEVLPLPDGTDCKCYSCKRETLSMATGVWGCDCKDHGEGRGTGAR